MYLDEFECLVAFEYSRIKSKAYQHEVMEKNVLDAVVNMIEWLIKEGHLDNKYLAVKCGDCRLIEDEDTNGEAWCAFHQKTGKGDGEACSNLSGKGAQNA